MEGAISVCQWQHSAGASAVAPVHDGSAILAGYFGQGELFLEINTKDSLLQVQPRR